MEIKILFNIYKKQNNFYFLISLIFEYERKKDFKRKEL